MSNPKKIPRRAVVISGVHVVRTGDVQIHATTVVITQDPTYEGHEPLFQVMGFGYCVSNLAFCMRVKTFEHQLLRASDRSPLVSGNTGDAIVAIDGRELVLALSLDGVGIERLEHEVLDVQGELSRVIERSIVEHWNAPNMPTVVWLPKAKAVDLRRTAHRP